MGQINETPGFQDALEQQQIKEESEENSDLYHEGRKKDAIIQYLVSMCADGDVAIPMSVFTHFNGMYETQVVLDSLIISAEKGEW